MSLLLIVAMLIAAADAPPASFQVAGLGAGSPVSRTIAAGESQTVEITIDAGRTALIEIEEHAIDLDLKVIEPSGHVIARVSDLFGGHGRRQAIIAAETGGVFALTLSARPWPIASGSYTLRLTGLRPFSAGDQERLQAMRLWSQAAQAEEAGRLQPATTRAAEALAVAERGTHLRDVDLALVVFDLGQLYDNGAERQKARPLYERSLSLLERSVGPNHPRVANVLRRLGVILSTEGDFVRADSLIRRALEIQEKALGPDDPELGLTLRDHGILLERLGDLTKAEEMSLRALAILEKADGRIRLQAGSVLNNLGVLYIGRRDYARAGEYLERALPLMEVLYGADSTHLAVAFQNLGIVAREARDYAKAEAYYLRALASRERSLGSEHPDIAATLINIANVYRSKGDFQLALETHLRALRMFERTAGPSAPFRLLALVNVARTYAILGDTENAVAYQTRLEQATETAIGLNLFIGSERQRVAYLTPIAERTERTLSLNLQLSPGDPASTALAVTVLLQRKRLIDAAADVQAAVRRHADSESLALLDQLTTIVGQLARLVVNGPQRTPLEEYRRSIGALEERKEQLESLSDLTSPDLSWEGFGSVPGQGLADPDQTITFLRQGSVDGPLFLAAARGRFASEDRDRIALYQVTCQTPDCAVGDDIEVTDSINGKRITPYANFGFGSGLINLKQANLAAASWFHVTPSGELIFYATEHDNDGPNGTVKAGEWRHVEVVREDSPTLLPTAMASGPHEVNEGGTLTLTGAAGPPVTRAFLQIYDGLHFAGHSWIADIDDIDLDDFERQRNVTRTWNWYAPVGCTPFGVDREGASARTRPGTGAIGRDADLRLVLNDAGTGHMDQKIDEIGFDRIGCEQYYTQPFVLRWDLDVDGSFESLGSPLTFDARAFDGPSEVVVAARAEDASNGPSGVTSARVTVLNVAPELSAFGITDSAGNQVNTQVPFVLTNLPVTTSARFSDPGVLDHQTAMLAWGDGAVDAHTAFATFDEAFGDATGAIAHTHRYAAAGSYRLALSVSDDDGGEDFESTVVRVVTPEQAVNAIIGLIDVAMIAATDHDIRKSLEKARKALAGSNSHSNNGALQKIRAGQQAAAMAFLQQAVSWLARAQADGADAAMMIALLQQVIAALSA